MISYGPHRAPAASGMTPSGRSHYSHYSPSTISRTLAMCHCSKIKRRLRGGLTDLWREVHLELAADCGRITLALYRRRAFRKEVRASTMLRRAFDKAVRREPP